MEAVPNELAYVALLFGLLVLPKVLQRFRLPSAITSLLLGLLSVATYQNVEKIRLLPPGPGNPRNSEGDFIELKDGRVLFVYTHFTGGRSELDACLALDLHIGITGWVCDERRGADLRAAVPLIPLDRLLIETDAPYLLPRDLDPKPRNRRNEPQFLTHVLERVAALKGESAEAIAKATTANAERLFGLPAR